MGKAASEGEMQKRVAELEREVEAKRSKVIGWSVSLFLLKLVFVCSIMALKYLYNRYDSKRTTLNAPSMTTSLV